MEKPFELKDLGNRVVKRLKGQAVGVADDVLSWVGESCLAHNNNFVKIVGGMVIGAKAGALAELKKTVEAQQLAANTIEVPKKA